MSSPTSDASSSHSSLDILDDAREQSTKDRRRERNRLAAQKHRLRRNERMSQLEQQVLALQQEKHQLLHRLEDASTAAHSAAAAAGLPPPDLDDLTPQRLPHHPPPSPAAAGDPRSSPRPAKRARTSGSANGIAAVHLRERVPVDPHLVEQSQTAQASLIHRMEERIVELERWHEELNGDLQDALDSEARLKADLHHSNRHADAHARRLADALQAAEAEQTRQLREIVVLRDNLGTQSATLQSLREANQRLRESLEGTEVTLDLQRVENERLRDRLAAEDKAAALNAHRLEDELDAVRRQLEDALTDNQHLRKLLAHQEQDSEEAAAAAARHHRMREEGERRRAEEREAAADEHIAELTHSINETKSLFAKQNDRLERVQADLEQSELERLKLSNSVSSLQGALEKVRAFLTSKGIPIDLD